MEETIPKLELTPISASRVKTFENCSWLYYCKYILKIPEPNNEGALKGSVCHSIFELLLTAKHRSKYDAVVKAGALSGCPSVDRLTRAYMRKNKLPVGNPAIYELIDKMILVGLKNDFFVKGGTLVKPEYEFNILNQDPVYLIKGFIDKPFIKGKKIIVDDFKSSKKKFEGEDVESNLQALIYSLACTKIWPELEPEVRFIFLQFPDDPIMKVKFTKEQLKGLEYYLTDIQKRLNGFSLEKAYSNMASNQDIPTTGEFKGKLLCGFAKKPGQLKKDGSLMFACPMKWEKKYFVVKRGDKVIKSYLNKEDIVLKEGDVIEDAFYNGCPSYRNVLDGMPKTPIQKKFQDPLDDF
jgi:hypothetical protein